jgi:predicted KAP-like P-loop ATPase
MNKKSSKYLLSSDRPITQLSEDLLGRVGFADSLASAIKGWSGNDSLVIALYGAWGSGKSSIKNMTLELLRKDKKDCPFVVEFTPWQWAGQEQLAEAFFREIGIVLENADKTKGKKRAAKWHQYGSYLTMGASITRSLKVVLPLLGVPGSGILDVISKGLEESSILTKEGADLTEQPESNLNEIKRELSKMLKSLSKPILVVMDDVDRLSADEIKLLFQLVKANADFPNIIYLLLFQRDIVEKSLESISPLSGGDFLEKIIQVGFDIPKVERSRLEKVLLTKLDELLGEKVIEKRFNQHRWGNIYIPGLSYYFVTLRDVYRFLATISFHISLFRNEGSFEVNPIDLIALEVLRVFEPRVYHNLFEMKQILTNQSGIRYEGLKDEARKTIENLVKQASESNRNQVKEIIKQLFPPIEWVFGGAHYSSDFEEEWYRDLRVCHPDVFDRYFHFTIPEGDISQADIDRILSLTGNREDLLTEFKSLNSRGLLAVALNRLEAYKEKINLHHAVPFITALMDIADELPEEVVGFFSIGSDMHISRIIHWNLKQEKDVKKRGQILKKAMKETRGLYMPVMKTSLEDSKQERQKAPNSFVVNEDDLKDLINICVEKITQAAESGALMGHPKMDYILYHWRKWASPEEPQKWVARLIETQAGLLSFLASFLSQTKSHGMGDYVYRTDWRISLESIENFISADRLAEKIETIESENLSEKEQIAVSTFQKALKRRKEGKPDEDWRDDDD